MWKTVKRPWGSYKVIARGDCYQIKILAIKPGHRTSLQSHEHRTEQWIPISGGRGIFEIGDRRVFAHAGGDMSWFVGKGIIHRITAERTLKAPFLVLEIQRGENIDERDIVRYYDDYGRIRK